MLLGTGLMAITLLIVRVTIVPHAEGTVPNLDQPAAMVLLGGTLVSLMAASVTAWTLLAPIGSFYRRGGLAIVCGFGTLLVSQVSVLLHQFFGKAGLVGLLFFCVVGCILMGRRLARPAA
ncbi:MAG: hypothetical protein ACREL6_08910 [Gemmatimonadales bacterium]